MPRGVVSALFSVSPGRAPQEKLCKLYKVCKVCKLYKPFFDQLLCMEGAGGCMGGA